MNLAEELLLCSIGDDGCITSSHKIAAVVGGGLVAELSLAGRLRIEDGKLVPGDPTPIGVRKPETYRLTPVGEEPRTRAREALAGTQPVDPRTTTLAALVVASGYHKVIVPRAQWATGEQRGQVFAAGDGVAPAVVDAIAAVRATAASLAA